MKIAALIANRANLARSLTVLEALSEMPGVELVVIACSSFVLEKFGRPVDGMPKLRGMKVIEVFSNIEGETLETQAKSTGLLITELAGILKREEVTSLIVVADRFEVVCGAIAASYQNIPLIHIQGGEVSGNIDDKVRNAVTMFADLHFPCSAPANDRLSTMTGRKGAVHQYGCPAMDLVYRHEYSPPVDVLRSYSHVGHLPEPGEPYTLVVFHPETELYDEARARAAQLLDTICGLPDHTIVMLWPNIDAGSDAVAKSIRVFRERNPDAKLSVFKHLSADNYLDVMMGAQILVGNSSSFLREGAHLAKPAVVVGVRQSGRDTGENVIIAPDLGEVLKQSILEARTMRPKASSMYGTGDAGERIAQEIVGFLAKR